MEQEERIAQLEKEVEDIKYAIEKIVSLVGLLVGKMPKKGAFEDELSSRLTLLGESFLHTVEDILSSSGE